MFGHPSVHVATKSVQSVSISTMKTWDACSGLLRACLSFLYLCNLCVISRSISWRTSSASCFSLVHEVFRPASRLLGPKFLVHLTHYADLRALPRFFTAFITYEYSGARLLDWTLFFFLRSQGVLASKLPRFCLFAFATILNTHMYVLLARSEAWRHAFFPDCLSAGLS